MTEISKALNEYARNAGLTLPGPVAEEDWLKRVVEMVLQALIDGEAASVIGASRYERTEERANHRNGRREIEPFRTRVGEIALSVPKLRKGSYYPSFLDARKPVERALLTTIQTAYVAGVSTRRVDELVQALGLTGIDKSAVSRICKELDDAVKPFRERALEIEYPYVFLDAVYLKARQNNRTLGRALVIAIGVGANGRREILGFELGPSEEEAFWLQFLRGLIRRGLRGTQLVISDAHEGLKGAISKALPGSVWQRCRVYFMRNLLGRIPHADKPVVAAMVRTVFAQPNRESADIQLEEIAKRMEKRWPDVANFLRNADDEILAYMAFPSAHWTRLYSTNSLERVNREVRRRSDVVQVFPDDASILRLIGTVLMDISDEWAVDERPYFSQNSMRLLLEPEMATTEPGPALAPVR